MNDINSNSDAMLHMIVPKLSGNMRFMGMYFIIVGSFICLSIIGAVIGIPYVLAGLRLRESADAFMLYLNNNDKASLSMALERQDKFFFIYKVTLIIGFTSMVLYIVLFFLFISGFNNGRIRGL